MAIGGDLEAVGEAFAQIVHQQHGIFARTVADVIGDDQFRVGINRGPSPNITRAFRSSLCCRDILLLGVAERLDFIALDARCLHVADMLVMNGNGSLPSLDQQLRDLVNRHAPQRG